jgi:hypothetical protein
MDIGPRDERHQTFAQRVKRRTQAFLPNAESAAWTLLASAQIVTRKVDGWQNLFKRPFARIHRPRRMIRYPQTAGESLKINSNTNRAGIKYLPDQRVFIRSRTYLRANPSLNGLLDQVCAGNREPEFNYERKYRWLGTPLSRSEAARASPPAFR